MRGFLELHLYYANGAPVWVRPSAIAAVAPAPNGCVLQMVGGGDPVAILETLEQFTELLRIFFEEAAR